MKRLFYVLLLIQMVGCTSTNNLYQCVAQFDGRGEISLSYNEIKDGLDFNLETSDPVALRALLMQGFRLCITKSGIDDTVSLSFPSAKDVSRNIEHHPGEVKATLDKNNEKRPDLRPLVAALNDAEVVITDNKDNHVPLPCHSMEVNASTGTLAYKFIVPYDIFNPNNLGFKVTLLSQPNLSMSQKDEFKSQNFVSHSKDNRPQPFGVGQENDNNQKKEIRLDFNF